MNKKVLFYGILIALFSFTFTGCSREGGTDGSDSRHSYT